MDILTICSIVVAILVLPGVLILFLRPSFTLKLIVWFLRHTFLRLRIEGVENIPDSPEGIILESLLEGYEHSNGHNKNQIWIETVYIRCKSKAEFVKRIPLFH